jgi:DNA-3-methyladenine glycosylase
MSVLDAEFFRRPALRVARELLGKHLVRRRPDGGRESAAIHETEAYIGPQDLACHAARGLTPRTSVLFGPPGRWYVYFVYGIHWMLNAVTGDEGYPAAVLIRGAGPWIGPARLTRGLAIDKQFNGLEASERSGLWIEDRGLTPPRGAVRRTPRIGVDYAGAWAAKPYRFVVEPSHFGLPETPRGARRLLGAGRIPRNNGSGADSSRVVRPGETA